MTATLTLAQWGSLFGHFLLLSMLSIGGAITVAPDMQRYMVGDMHFIDATQFNSSIAIAQASPGPNVLFVAVLGYQAAGLLGVAATLLGILLPSTTLAFAAARWGFSRPHGGLAWRMVAAFKTGMAPITLALMAATGWILTVDAPGGPHARIVALTLAATVLVWRTRLHLLWLIAAGAALGALGWL
ncbi:MAG: chromate transporter [Betaproteobacteria bacterium]|nr:chromate transporter [Betaproteobacteria bacterium]